MIVASNDSDVAAVSGTVLLAQQRPQVRVAQNVSCSVTCVGNFPNIFNPYIREQSPTPNVCGACRNVPAGVAHDNSCTSDEYGASTTHNGQCTRQVNVQNVQQLNQVMTAGLGGAPPDLATWFRIYLGGYIALQGLNIVGCYRLTQSWCAAWYPAAGAGAVNYRNCIAAGIAACEALIP